MARKTAKHAMVRQTAKRARAFRGAWMVLAVIVLVIVVVIRIRLLGIPLERDEGEYAYAGQLMLQGIPPYQLAYNMKFPGTYAAYAVIMAIFGQTIAGIHIGLLLVNLAAIALIFFLGRRLCDTTAAIAAAATYAVLSVSPSVVGLAAHAEHFVVLPVLGGTLLLLKACNWPNSIRHDQSGAERSKMATREIERAAQQSVPSTDVLPYGELCASGLLFGFGLLMKQPAVFLIVFGAIFLLWNDIRRRFTSKSIVLRFLTFAAGAVLPFVITCLLLWRAGVFHRFWFWTIDYARQYASLVPISEAPKIFAESTTKVIGISWGLWLLAGLGLVTGFWAKRTRESTVLLLAFLTGLALALSSGFYFREHYFILVLPAVSLLAGVAMSRLEDFVRSHIKVVQLAPVIVLAAALGLPVFAERTFFFEASPLQASRKVYGLSPFPESVRIAEYLRDHTGPSDTIAVLGSEPQIYFYSSRHAATGYIYMYGLMELQRYARQMQEEMIREIESAVPKYLVLVKISGSWLRRPGSESLIFDWVNDQIKQFYDVVGLVNILPLDHTDYYLDELPRPMPQLGNYILICRRKD